MQQANPQPRLRVRYKKDGRLAFLGHLEVINTHNRSIRRSGVPFAVGNGFARRMRLQFSQALPVGASSECEYFDLMLTEKIEASRALEMLVAATPAALAPQDAAYVDRSLPALEAWLTRALWRVEFLGRDVDAAALDQVLAELRGEGDLEYLRGDKPKHIDLSSARVGWTLDEVDGRQVMSLETRSSNAGALRPQVLLDAAFARMGASEAEAGAPELRVARVGQWHEADDGHLVNAL